MKVINADKLMADLNEFFKKQENNAYHTGNRNIKATWSDAIEIVKEQKPINKKKIGVAEWLWKLNDYGWADTTCSECGWTDFNDVHVWIGYKYCPNCGRYMTNHSLKKGKKRND